MAVDKKPAKSGAPKKGVSRKLYKLYTISGDKIVCKNKTCPKCGPGMFLGQHQNRVYCGNCHYTEFTGKR